MAGQKGSGKAWCELGDLYGYTSLVPDGIGEAIACYQKAAARASLKPSLSQPLSFWNSRVTRRRQPWASLKDLKIWVDVIFLHGESRLTPPRDWS